MMNVTNRTTMLPCVEVDSITQLDISRIDFKDYDFGKDSYFMIKSNEYARPDLMSLRVYGTPSYWWFVMWYNGFSDPWHDLMPNTIFKVPQLTRVEEAIKLHKYV